MWSNETISWAVVDAFAAGMWNLKDYGFTPGHFSTFVSPSGIELSVSLRVRSMATREVEGKPGPKTKTLAEGFVSEKALRLEDSIMIEPTSSGNNQM